jgi:hypothetical protein
LKPRQWTRSLWNCNQIPCSYIGVNRTRGLYDTSVSTTEPGLGALMTDMRRVERDLKFEVYCGTRENAGKTAVVSILPMRCRVARLQYVRRRTTKFLVQRSTRIKISCKGCICSVVEGAESFRDSPGVFFVYCCKGHLV